MRALSRKDKATHRQAVLRQRGVALLVGNFGLKLTHQHVHLLLRIAQAALQGAQQRHAALVFRQAVLKFKRVLLKRAHDAVKLGHGLAKRQLLDRLFVLYGFHIMHPFGNRFAGKR